MLRISEVYIFLSGVIVNGGGERDRTDDLVLAKHALSQLSYAPIQFQLAVLSLQIFMNSFIV